MISRLLRAVSIVLVLTLLFVTVVFAATWEFKFPATVISTATTARTYYPVLLGYTGQTLIDAGKIAANGLDTNMQVGSTSVPYMITTTKVTAVVPNLPIGGQAVLDLYTGYAPIQTNFPVIVGDGGYVTTLDNANLEFGSQFTSDLKGYVDTTHPFPVVEATNGGNDVVDQLNHTVNLPSGIKIGDLLLVFFASDGTPVVTFPAGWTNLFEVSSGTAVDFGGWYRIADGTEAATITVTTDAVQMTAHTSYRITHYIGVPVVGADVTGTSVNPNPPNLAPAWNIANTLWFAATGYDTQETVSAYPVNYTNGRNDYANAAGGTGVGTARRELAAASDNPGTFTITAAEEWVAETIAIEGESLLKKDASFRTYISAAGAITSQMVGGGNPSVTVTGVTSGVRRVVTSDDGVVTMTLSVYDDAGAHVGNSPQTVNTAGAACADNGNSWILDSGTVIPYITYYKHSTVVGGWSEKIEYQPVTMLTGTTVSNEDNPGTYDGTITWGANSALTIVYGAMVSYESTTASTTAGVGFTMPSSLIPSTWFAMGQNVANLPFYDSFNGVATQTGIPVQTIYFWLAIGIAFGVALFLMAFTRSALLGVLAMNIVLFIASSQTIVPMWIPFSILIVQVAIMYLYRQVSY